MIMSSADLIPRFHRLLRRRSPGMPSARWIAPAAVGAVALIAVAGCGTAGTTAGGKPLTARQALRLAASQSQRVNSLTATLTVRTGTGSAGGLTTGAMKIQLKPATLIDASFSGTSAGTRFNLEEILTHEAIYLKSSAIAQHTGKPWLKISVAQLSSKTGINFASLLQSLENTNPLAQARLFSVSKNVHAVGTQVINGIRTTEYAGSYDPSAAMTALSPALRKLLGPMLRSMGAAKVQFHIWIDGQHLIRKAASTETIGGQTVISSYDVTSINQPITVTLPPASQTASLPNG
jgi:hypothetical protein